MLTKSAKFTVFALLASVAVGHSQQLFSSTSSRPLSELAQKLSDQYGLVVSYEEAPINPTVTSISILANGATVHVLPKIAASWSLPDSIGPWSPDKQLSGFILPLVNAYNRLDKQRQYTAQFEGDAVHIVPTSVTVNGKASTFQPILTTLITQSENDISCDQALNQVLNQVATTRGVTINTATLPIGSLLTKRCTVVVNGLAARDVIANILDQLSGSVPVGFQRSRWSWFLMYDLNLDAYFFSTRLLPSRALSKQVSTPLNNAAVLNANQSSSKVESGKFNSIGVKK